MDVLVSVFLPVSLAFIMFALGLGLRAEDFFIVARRPRAFAIGAFAQVVLVPALAYLVIVAFDIAPELAVGIMILSLCPGGPTTNMLTRIGRGDLALSISLTGVISLTSAITVPILVAFFTGHFLGRDAPRVDVTRLSLTMFAITVLPVLLGMAVRRLNARADRLERGALAVAGLLFTMIVVAAIIVNWSLDVGSLPLLGPALLTLVVALLVVGLLLSRLAGLHEAQATSIAIDTGIQNGTLGLTVGTIIAASDLSSPFALPSAAYAIVMYVVAVPFTLWRRSNRAAETAS